MYIWQKTAWPRLEWDVGKLAQQLAKVRHKQGLLLGKMSSLGFTLQSEAFLETLSHDVLKTSEIEGEILDARQVRSSVARRLGMDVAGLPEPERHVDGVVDMMLDATENYKDILTKERLFGWHAALFPVGYSGIRKVRVGQWRGSDADPMQVVSGSLGREKVHYEAPPAKSLDHEMQVFLDWFNQEDGNDLVIKSGLAHLWFVTIHPFEDGNGRIARALADLVLSRSEGSPRRFYSMSTQIRAERNRYYDILESTQRGGTDVTEWLEWFLSCLERAIDGAESTLKAVMAKASFWDEHRNKKLNERQVVMLNKLLDGFAGNLTTSKWAKISKCSQDTAYRDILDLVEKGVLRKGLASGRSAHYEMIGF